jgi:hypothetical protein
MYPRAPPLEGRKFVNMRQARGSLVDDSNGGLDKEGRRRDHEFFANIGSTSEGSGNDAGVSYSHAPLQVQRLKQTGLRVAPHFRTVHGHFRGDAYIGAPRISFLREPVANLVSMYCFGGSIRLATVRGILDSLSKSRKFFSSRWIPVCGP